MNMMHGKGVFTWPDYRRYEGNYEEDEKKGDGAYFWPDGKTYIGQFLNGKQHGLGFQKARDQDSPNRDKMGRFEDGQLKEKLENDENVLKYKEQIDSRVKEYKEWKNNAAAGDNGVTNNDVGGS